MRSGFDGTAAQQLLGLLVGCREVADDEPAVRVLAAAGDDLVEDRCGVHRGAGRAGGAVEIPVLPGLQFQGDVAVVPVTREPARTPVPTDGTAVVRGQAKANTHLLLGVGDARFDRRTSGDQLVLGLLTVARGATAYLAHPEHAFAGIAPGTYELRRQREQADRARLIAD